MTQSDIDTAIANELARIAPDIPLDEVDRSGDIRDEFDIDSMDFLKLITALGKRYELPMPEADYGKMGTFDDLSAYIAHETRG